MTLYIDEGNTRIKAWWVERGQVLLSWQGVDLHALVAQLPQAAGQQVDLVVASVRRVELLLQGLHRTGLAVGKLTVVGVDRSRLDTVYADALTLGIDRWLAVLAVKQMQPAGRPALVIDAGTAVTMDVLTPDGRHGGGYILPGLSLQLDALARHTQRVQVSAPRWRGIEFGQDTPSCVSHGVLAAMVAMANQAVVTLKTETGQVPTLWLTGGDAGIVGPHLPQAVLNEHLVLQGMMAAAS